MGLFSFCLVAKEFKLMALYYQRLFRTDSREKPPLHRPFELLGDLFKRGYATHHAVDKKNAFREEGAK